MQLGYALPFALAVTVETVQANLHQYVVSASSDAASFAVYSVALLQIPLVDQTATTTGTVAMVQMGEAIQQGRPQDVRRLWHDIVAKLAALFFPLVALLVVAGRDLILVLFTARYQASVPLFQLSSLGILLFVLQPDTVLRVMAQTRFLLVLNVVRLAVVAATIGPALGRLQLAGAVLATLAGAVVARGLGLVRIGQLLHLTLGTLLPWRKLAAAALASTGAGLVALAVRALVPWSPLPSLVVVSGCFAAAYAALAWQLGLVPAPGPGGWVGWLRGGPVAVRAILRRTS
jgi:O-antigen/teichoic acid export membrane protein